MDGSSRHRCAFAQVCGSKRFRGKNPEPRRAPSTTTCQRQSTETLSKQCWGWGWGGGWLPPTVQVKGLMECDFVALMKKLTDMPDHDLLDLTDVLGAQRGSNSARQNFVSIKPTS